MGVLALCALVSGLGSDGAAAEGRRPGGANQGEAALTRPAGPPVMVVVSLNQQRVTVYDADGPILHSPVSSGKPGYDTPVGIYTVLQREVEHTSNLYDASMPFMQRLTWSGVALHAGIIPGYPASAGCVRMPMDFAEELFERGRLGMRVLVVRDDITPVVGFSHPALLKPALVEPAPAPGAPVSPEVTKIAAEAAGQSGAAALPRTRVSLKAAAAAKSEAASAATKKAEELRLEARTATLEAGRAGKALYRAEAALQRAERQLRQAEQWVVGTGGKSERALKTRTDSEVALAAAQADLAKVKAEVQPKLDLAAKLREDTKAASEAATVATEEAKAAARKLLPVSVFISRATQRLYVRQAREPLFDVPVTIAEPGRPLGTYVFSALSYNEGETDLRWSAVSMYAKKAGPGTTRYRNRRAGPQVTDVEGAKAALDRIAIPKEARERLAELMAPGASLIVSDEGLSQETGAATEFIVLMSGEPQGGIRIRPREARVKRYQTSPASYSTYSAPSFLFW